MFFQYFFCLQRIGVGMIENRSSVPSGIVCGGIHIDIVALHVEICGCHSQCLHAVVHGVDHHCFGLILPIVAPTGHNHSVVGQGFDSSRVQPHGYFPRLAKAAKVHHRQRAVKHRTARCRPLPAVAHIQLVPYHAQLFGLQSAQVAFALYFQCGGVNPRYGFIVARHIHLALVPRQISRSRMSEIYLPYADSCFRVYHFQHIRGEHRDIQFVSIMYHVLCQIAQSALVVTPEPVCHHILAVAVQQADFCIIASPQAFAQQVYFVVHICGGRPFGGGFCAACRHCQQCQHQRKA